MYFRPHLKHVTTLPCKTSAADTSTFSKSLMVFVGMFKFEKMHLILLDLGLKINSAYYRDVLLT